MRSFSASLGHTLPPGLGIGNVCALLQIDRRRNEGTLLHIAICDDEARHMRQLAALLDNGRSAPHFRDRIQKRLGKLLAGGGFLLLT